MKIAVLALQGAFIEHEKNIAFTGDVLFQNRKKS